MLAIASPSFNVNNLTPDAVLFVSDISEECILIIKPCSVTIKISSSSLIVVAAITFHVLPVIL
jgi:hypothetical protein